MSDFEKILNESLLRSTSKMMVSHIEEMRFKFSDIDIEKEIKYQMAHNIANDLLKKDKIEITETDKTNQGISVTEYSTELFVCNQKNLFEIFSAFNKMSENARRSFLKWCSPSPEKFQNQIREENLRKIFDDNDFEYNLNNI